MADTDRLVPLLERHPGVNYWALVPNERGLERARACGIGHVCLLASATETHSRKNLNRAVAATMADNAQVARRALGLGMKLRGYVSVAFGCPYEGGVDFARVLELAQQYFDCGVGEVSLGDTTGVGRPLQVRAAARTALDRFGAARIAFHLHDTRGTGLTNAYAVLEEGAEILDSSTGGIGGCPYAPGAAGNLATDDLVNLLAGMGIESSVDVQEVVNTTRWLREGAGISPRSRYFQFVDSQPT
jgi:hydroxymethylglutaryl-CoA lyase